MLTAAYGGAVMGGVILVLTLWGRSKGCDFPINDNSILSPLPKTLLP